MLEYCSLWQAAPTDSHTGIERTPYVSSSLLNQYQAEGDIFQGLIITRDETCCYEYELECEVARCEFPIKEEVQDAAHSR